MVTPAFTRMLAPDTSLGRLRKRKVVPIHDFIIAKRQAYGLKKTNAALRAIQSGLIPNTAAWFERFKTNTPVKIDTLRKDKS